MLCNLTNKPLTLEQKQYSNHEYNKPRNDFRRFCFHTNTEHEIKVVFQNNADPYGIEGIFVSSNKPCEYLK